MSQVTIYVKASGNCIVYDKNTTLGDVLKIECTNTAILRAVKQMELYRFNHEHSVVFSILKVIEIIHKEYPNTEVVNCGESDFIVEYQKSTVKSKIWERIKLILIAIIVFFGSAFTIMTFNEDAGLDVIFARVYDSVSGDPEGNGWLEVCYSLGLPLGILLFFNHFASAKLSNDPTPLQIQMRQYEQQEDTTIIENAARKGERLE